MAQDTIAAVVPHHNRRDLLATLLDNLAAQTRRFDQVIVADNGSSDGSAELAESAGARVLRLGRNLGFAAAVNRGIEAATTSWIAILNNDVTLSRDWLEVLLAAASREQAWFATSKILSAADPSRLDGSFDEISRAGCACRCGAGAGDGEFWNRARRIRMAPMTAALFRRKLFDEIGPLDERFESYLEDVDFGLRCAMNGRTGIYQPATIAYHWGSSTWGRWSKDSVRLLARNQILLTKKHFRGQPRWPIVAGQLLWGLVALRHGCGAAYLTGKIAGLRDRIAGTGSEPGAFRQLVEESEKEILAIQRQTGFDRYWRAYFCLLRP